MVVPASLLVIVPTIHTMQSFKHHLACIVLKSLVSCLWGCGESVNPPKLNIEEVLGTLSSSPNGDPGPLPIFQDFVLLSNHTPDIEE